MTRDLQSINKSKKYGHVYGTQHKLSGGRVAWPHLVDAKENTFPVEEGAEKPAPRFEVTYLSPKDDPELEAIKAEAQEMVDLYNFDEKTGKPKKNKLVVDLDELFDDGDSKDTDKYPFFANSYVLVPKHKERPEIYDSQLNLLDPSQVEGGMPVVLVIKPICTSHGISFQLLVVQAGVDDGVRFGGSAPAAKGLLEVLGGGKAVEPSNGKVDEAPFEEDSDEETEDSDEEDITSAPAPIAAKVKAKSAKGTLNLDKLA